MKELQPINGFCDDHFKIVEQVFRQNFTEGLEVGASFAVVLKGKLVVDLWAGYRDVECIKPWKEDTIVNTYSTTKIITTLCFLMCVDRGLMSLDAPVSKYWPEFAQAGKEKIPVRYLLSHTAGIPGFKQKMSIRDYYDWDKIIKILAAQKPWWTPGSKSGYHAITFGYLIGNLVKIVTGKSIGTFFRDEIALPLNIDFHIGIPAEIDTRITDVIPFTIPRWLLLVGKIIFPTMMQASANPNPNEMIDATNTREWRSAEIPASNGHGNARSVAQVGSILANGGTFQNKKILDSKIIDLALQPQIKNYDIVLREIHEWGLGFSLNLPDWTLGPRSFMWGGLGGSKCVMDRENQISAAYVMNKLIYGKEYRGEKLIQAVKKCI